MNTILVTIVKDCVLVISEHLRVIMTVWQSLDTKVGEYSSKHNHSKYYFADGQNMFWGSLNSWGSGKMWYYKMGDLMSGLYICSNSCSIYAHVYYLKGGLII